MIEAVKERHNINKQREPFPNCRYWKKKYVKVGLAEMWVWI